MDKDDSRLNDLAAKLGETVEAASAAALERLTRPILTAVRAVVLASIVVALVTFLIVTGAIGLVRLFDTSVFPSQTWATDLLVAGIFLAAGALCWTLSGRGKKVASD